MPPTIETNGQSYWTLSRSWVGRVLNASANYPGRTSGIIVSGSAWTRFSTAGQTNWYWFLIIFSQRLPTGLKFSSVLHPTALYFIAVLVSSSSGRWKSGLIWNSILKCRIKKNPCLKVWPQERNTKITYGYHPLKNSTPEFLFTCGNLMILFNIRT